MRCFIPATDDELYAFIDRHGVAALVPYRVGLPTARQSELHQGTVVAGIAVASLHEEPRLAA